MTVEVVRDLGAFLPLRNEWEALRARARFASSFLSHKWLRLSWEMHGSRWPDRVRVVLVREDGQLVMAGAFVLNFFNFLPAIGFLGSNTPQSDDVLYVASARSTAHARAVLTALRQQVWSARTLRSQRLRDDSPLLAAAAEMGLTMRTRNRIAAVQLTLSKYDGFEQYLDSLSRKTREGHRRQWRRIQELDGFRYVHETGEDRFAAIAWLLDTKRRWARAKNKTAPWLQDRTIDRFTERLLRGEDAPEFWVPTMRIGDRIIAAKLCLVERETLNYSKITHDPEFDLYSPGFTLNVLMIRDAFAAGLQRIDFGHGTVETKRRLSKEIGQVLVERIELK